MWAWLAFAAFAAAAMTNAAAAAPIQGAAPIPAAEQAGLPTFTPPDSLLRGDLLDEWCKGPTTALNIAVCSDDQLRALAIERLRAFDEARRRIGADQQRELAADQNGWAMSYPQACGLPSNLMPSLPLAPSVKQCLAKAGRERLTYLRGYGTAGAGTTPAAASPVTLPSGQPAPPQQSQLTAAAAPPFAPGAQSQSQTPTGLPSPVQNNAVEPPPQPAAAPSLAQNAGASPQPATDGKPSAASGNPPIEIPPAAPAPASGTAGPASPAAQKPAPPAAQTPPAVLRETPALKPASTAPSVRSHIPEWGTWRGNAVLGAVAIGVFCIGLWVGAAAKARRRGKEPEPSAASPVNRDARS
jgi:hypothetical protein